MCSYRLGCTRERLRYGDLRLIPDVPPIGTVTQVLNAACNYRLPRRNYSESAISAECFSCNTHHTVYFWHDNRRLDLKRVGQLRTLETMSIGTRQSTRYNDRLTWTAEKRLQSDRLGNRESAH